MINTKTLNRALVILTSIGFIAMLILCVHNPAHTLVNQPVVYKGDTTRVKTFDFYTGCYELENDCVVYIEDFEDLIILK